MIFWTSWWSDLAEVEPPFHYNVTGAKINRDFTPGVESYVALFEAGDAGAVWDCVKTHYPDMEPRFCNPTDGVVVSDRFHFPNPPYVVEMP